MERLKQRMNIMMLIIQLFLKTVSTIQKNQKNQFLQIKKVTLKIKVAVKKILKKLFLAKITVQVV